MSPTEAAATLLTAIGWSRITPTELLASSLAYGVARTRAVREPEHRQGVVAEAVAVLDEWHYHRETA